jgi:16S rRNA (cytidine1402-2'-O)-methyltransferase
MAQFFICATPIGNLSDVSKRLVETLKEVDLIYCEDTRRTAVLLSSLNIKKVTKSYFLGNEQLKISEILSYLEQGKKVALLSDAGTPLISDPGEELLKKVIENNFEIESIPGPSSVILALTLSGMDTKNFQFLGFIPKAGKEKQDFFNKIVNNEMTTVCFTSPNRVLKNLEYFDENSIDVEIAVCRELTKKFETIYRGTPGQLLNELEGKTLKGEITLVISKVNSKSRNSVDVSSAVEILLKNEVSKKDIAKVISLLTDRSVNEIYDSVKGL